MLIGLLALVIALFGSDSLSGGSQVALIIGMAVCIAISMIFYHVPWQSFEVQITKTIGNIAVTLLILLCVGMLAGSWMISGVVCQYLVWRCHRTLSVSAGLPRKLTTT